MTIIPLKPGDPFIGACFIMDFERGSGRSSPLKRPAGAFIAIASSAELLQGTAHDPVRGSEPATPQRLLDEVARGRRWLGGSDVLFDGEGGEEGLDFRGAHVFGVVFGME